MPTEAETLKEIQRLLANGETQAASDLAAAAELDAQKAADAASGKPSAPPPPREPSVIMVAFMDAVAGRFGHHHELDVLVTEMKAAFKAVHADQPEPAPKPAPAPAA